MGVFHCAALNRDQLLAELHGQLTGAAAADCKLAIMAGNRADRCHHSRGAASHSLQQFAAFRIRAPLIDAV